MKESWLFRVGSANIPARPCTMTSRRHVARRRTLVVVMAALLQMTGSLKLSVGAFTMINNHRLWGSLSWKLARDSMATKVQRSLQTSQWSSSSELNTENWGENSTTSADGDNVLESKTFSELYDSYLPDWLIQKCSDCGWVRPTRIQREALDAILLQGQDAIVQAETGSGKTLSYLLPLLSTIDASRTTVQALIVVPTRELGLQVARVAKRLAAASASSSNTDKIMVMSVLQGSQNRRQRAWAWAEPPHVVIGTPEELCGMIRHGGIKRYNSVNFVVVDEVDACLLSNAGSLTSNIASSTLHELLSKYLSPTFDDGKGIDVNSDTALERLQKASVQGSSSPSSMSNRPVSRKRQTVFCSATIPQHRHFLKQCVQNKWMLRDPVHVCLRPGEQMVPETLDHAYLVCKSSEKKLGALRRLVQKIYTSAKTTGALKKILVFCEPQRPLEEMALVLSRDIPDGKGVCWQESYGPEEEQNACAIVSVLRFEDSLSRRASAIDSFRGETYSNEHQEAASHEGPSLRLMLSTDLAARGLDIADISHVIHFDLPSDADTYLHRAGRAGRFGRKGQVLSIIPPEQEFVLQRLANKLNVGIKCIGRQKQKQSD